MFRIPGILIAVFAMFVLSACGGGGSGGGSTQTASPPLQTVTTAGAISGTVTTADGQPQSSVHVRAVLITDASVQAGQFTDSNGNYQIKGLPPGTYQVIAENIDGRNGVERMRISTSLSNATPVFPDEYYNGSNEAADDAPTDVQGVSVTDRQVTSNINITLNDSGGVSNNTVVGIGSTTPVAIGGTVNGILGELTDFTDDLGLGYFVDAYTLSGIAGQSVNISLASAVFDTVVIVLTPDGAVTFDDDSGGGTDSSLNLSITQNGPYLILVTSYNSGQKGAYTLSLTDNGSLPITPIAFGVPEADILQGGDTVIEGYFVDLYEFTATAGTPVTIALSSVDFDAYLILITPSGATEINDDANASTTDSLLTGALLESGTHTIAVSTFSPGESGSYNLSLTSP